MSGFFITGTDTGIGKTFVTCALIYALQQRGIVAAPMKPIAAGVPTYAAGVPTSAAGMIDAYGIPMNDDVALMMGASGHRFPLSAVNPYCFREAIAPHIAARHENIEVDLSVIRIAYRQLSDNADVVLVEGAGGFLVPLTDCESMALIPSALQLPVVVVVGMRLGCINHALLTVEAIRARGLSLAGWIANSCNETMNAYEENLSTLTRLMKAPLLGELPHIHSRNTLQTLQTLQAPRVAATHLHTELFIPATEQP